MRVIRAVLVSFPIGRYREPIDVLIRGRWSLCELEPFLLLG
jgi:hypothetical protein